MSRKPVLLLVNAHSRRGGGMGDAVAAALRGVGVPVRPAAYGRASELPGVIRDQAAGMAGVVVGGGDGTLTAALPGLLSTGLPLGVVPLGTANDLARTLGIPAGIEGAAAVVARGRTRAIDLGEVNGHPYLNVASVGFGVDLTRALTRDSKRRFGVLGYAVAALRAMRRLKPFTAEIRHGGQSSRSRTVHVAVGNGRHYGGGMTIAEDASISDGRLDVYSLEVAGFWRLLLLLPALRSGRHARWSDVRTLAGEAVEVRTRRPRSVNADGEIVARTPATFRVLPGALRVFVP